MKLNPEVFARFGRALLRHLNAILVILLVSVTAYTIYFATNLFYAKSDLDALAAQQETPQTKQIRFNQKTLDALNQLVPSKTAPDTSGAGRSNPFAP